MKATLSFDLDDPDERKAHLRATLATNMASVLFDIDGVFSRLRKQDFDSDTQRADWLEQEIRQALNDIPMSLDALL